MNNGINKQNIESLKSRGKSKIQIGLALLIIAIFYIIFISQTESIIDAKIKLSIYAILPGFIFLIIGLKQYFSKNIKAQIVENVTANDLTEPNKYLNRTEPSNILINESHVINTYFAKRGEYIFNYNKSLFHYITFIIGFIASIKLFIISSHYSGWSFKGDDFASLVLLCFIISLIIFLKQNYNILLFNFRHKKFHGTQFFKLDENILEFGVEERWKMTFPTKLLRKLSEYRRISKLYIGPNMLRLNPQAFTEDEITKIKEIIKKNMEKI
jgi:hypothetical protein